MADTIRAAGGVLWREADGGVTAPAVEVAIIHRPRYGDWTLPKGKLASGESEVDGAIREVLEETGYRPRLGRAMGETRYFKEQAGFLRPKVVRWWAMEATGGAFSPTRTPACLSRTTPRSVRRSVERRLVTVSWAAAWVP